MAHLVAVEKAEYVGGKGCSVSTGLEWSHFRRSGGNQALMGVVFYLLLDDSGPASWLIDILS